MWGADEQGTNEIVDALRRLDARWSSFKTSAASREIPDDRVDAVSEAHDRSTDRERDPEVEFEDFKYGGD